MRAGERPVALPTSTWRLVAYLAIMDRPVERARVANSLWMDKAEHRAHANLRSCLWRLRLADDALVQSTATHLYIREDVAVDLRELIRLTRRISDHAATIDFDEVDTDLLCSELLPDWYDDFVEIQREHLRQLRLHALEALALRLQKAGQTNSALDMAHTAVAAGPLRESAHRIVISIHLAEGNIAEALHQYLMLRTMLREQLGVEPSPLVRRLITPWLSSPAVRIDERRPLTVPT